MSNLPCVYILASRRNGTLYVGVTSNLTRRVWEHRSKAVNGFSDRYSVFRLVWYEVHASIVSAIEREKALKKWNRLWKLKMIDSFNPEWKDLYEELI